MYALNNVAFYLPYESTLICIVLYSSHFIAMTLQIEIRNMFYHTNVDSDGVWQYILAKNVLNQTVWCSPYTGILQPFFRLNRSLIRDCRRFSPILRGT